MPYCRMLLTDMTLRPGVESPDSCVLEPTLWVREAASDPVTVVLYESSGDEVEVSTSTVAVDTWLLPPSVDGLEELELCNWNRAATDSASAGLMTRLLVTASRALTG